MDNLDKPDIDEVLITTIKGEQLRVLPIEIRFDSPASKSSGEWKLVAYDMVRERDLDMPLSNITNWRAA